MLEHNCCWPATSLLSLPRSADWVRLGPLSPGPGHLLALLQPPSGPGQHLSWSEKMLRRASLAPVRALHSCPAPPLHFSQPSFSFSPPVLPSPTMLPLWYWNVGHIVCTIIWRAGVWSPHRECSSSDPRYIKRQKIATLKDEHLSYTSFPPQLSCPRTELRPVFKMFTTL